MAAKKSAKKRTTKASSPAAKPGTSKESRQERCIRFVDAYITHGENATQAALAIGLSTKSARTLGSRMLQDVDIQALLAERRAEGRKAFKFDADDAMRSVAQAVLFDPRKLFHQDGRRKMIHELDDDTAMGLQSLETSTLIGFGGPTLPDDMAEDDHDATDEEGNRAPLLYTVKATWQNKVQAREQAMKKFGLYKEDNSQRGADAIVALLGAIAANAATLEVKP